MKKIWIALSLLGVAVAINAVVMLNSWHWYGSQAGRIKAFNRSTVVRVDTEQCRKVEQNHTRCCQCLFEFEKSESSATLQFSPGTKVDRDSLDIPVVKSDGEVTDGYTNMVIYQGSIFVERLPVPVAQTPSFFFVKKDGTVYADAVDVP